MVNLHISLTPFKNESRVIKQTNSLIKHRLFDKIYVLALHEDGLAINESLSPQIEVHRIVLKTRSLSKGIAGQIIKYLELSFKILLFALKARPKVVNIHGLPLLPLGSLIKLLSGARLVYDTHELETETDGLTGLRQQLARKVERIFIRFANATVVVGNEIRNWYSAAYKCKNIVTVLNCPNYIEQDKTDLIRNEFGIESDRKIILYLGGISEGRGVRYLLDAFQMLTDHNYALVFIGYGDLEELVTAYSVKNKHIYLRNAVRPAEVIKYAASADIGVSIIEDNCLSYTYCLPNKLFEYTMAGIPTIISDLPEMRRVVDAYKIGIAIPAKANSDLEKALIQIDEIPIDEMKGNLLKAARELNWENQEKFYIDTIREVINKRN